MLPNKIKFLVGLFARKSASAFCSESFECFFLNVGGQILHYHPKDELEERYDSIYRIFGWIPIK